MPGAELGLALLAGLVAVIVLGPGQLAVDHQIGPEPAESLPEREMSLVRCSSSPDQLPGEDDEGQADDEFVGRAQRRVGFRWP